MASNQELGRITGGGHKHVVGIPVHAQTRCNTTIHAREYTWQSNPDKPQGKSTGKGSVAVVQPQARAVLP